MSASRWPAPRPFRGRYLANNPALRLALTGVDSLLRLRPRREVEIPAGPPRRVLLAMGGHLGDAVIASAVLPLVKQAWPEAEIGLLVGSWALPVVRGHPLVRWIHAVDHWKLNRSQPSLAARLRRYRETRERALGEMREVGYDLAVDLHPYFPNAAPLLWRARIPVRIGYESGGYGALYTHPVPWRDSARHTAEYHCDLLQIARMAAPAPLRLRYSLPPLPAGEPPAVDGEYLVVHMGAGLSLKEWPRERWRELVGRLLDEGHTLVFTGSGGGQAEEAERVGEGRAGCHNLCDRLSWSGFVRTLAGARLVVSIDSVAGHLAAAVDTPVVVLTSGMNRLEHWRPLGARVAVVTHPVPCAPCFRSRGCPGMECVRGIGVEQVMRAVRAQLAAPSPSVDKAASAW